MNQVSNYLDLLPEDLIGEIYFYLLSESKKLVEFGPSFKTVYDKMIKNITDGNIEPEQYFSLSTSNYADDIDFICPTPTEVTCRDVKYDRHTSMPISTDIDFLLDKSLYLYGIYKDVHDGWDGDFFTVYKIKYTGQNINDLITNKEYYVTKYYYWNSIFCDLSIDYSDSWKHMWNFILDNYRRQTIMGYNGYLENYVKSNY